MVHGHSALTPPRRTAKHLNAQRNTLCLPPQSKAAGIKSRPRILTQSKTYYPPPISGIDYVKQTAKFADSKLELQSPEVYSTQVGLSHTAILPNGIWLNNIGGTRICENTEHAIRQALYLCIQSNLIQNRPLGKWIVRKPSPRRQYSPA